MSRHDATTHSCDRGSAYTLASCPLRKISLTVTHWLLWFLLLRLEKTLIRWILTAWMLEGRCRWLCCWGCRWTGGVWICRLLPNCWRSRSKHLGLLLQQKGREGGRDTHTHGVFIRTRLHKSSASDADVIRRFHTTEAESLKWFSMDLHSLCSFRITAPTKIYIWRITRRGVRVNICFYCVSRGVRPPSWPSCFKIVRTSFFPLRHNSL